MSNFIDWTLGKGWAMNLVHCMGHNYLLIGLFVLGCVSVVLVYLAIAMHGYSIYKKNPKTTFGRNALNMVRVFVFCGLCYLFYPIKIWIPAYPIFTFILFYLSYESWRFYFRCKKDDFFEQLFGKAIRSIDERTDKDK